MSYYAFAAAVTHYGVRAAANAARIYGVPLEQALEYLRRYAVEGYIV